MSEVGSRFVAVGALYCLALSAVAQDVPSSTEDNVRPHVTGDAVLWEEGCLVFRLSQADWRQRVQRGTFYVNYVVKNECGEPAAVGPAELRVVRVGAVPGSVGGSIICRDMRGNLRIVASWHGMHRSRERQEFRPGETCNIALSATVLGSVSQGEEVAFGVRSAGATRLCRLRLARIYSPGEELPPLPDIP